MTPATLVPVELLRKYDRPGPRYTSYPTVPVWSDRIGPDDYATALRAASQRTTEPLALYCHVPFCRRRCYYCGCNTVVTKDRSRAAGYVEILGREIDTVAAMLGDRRQVSLLHFGGGTPTYLTIEEFTKLLDYLRSHFAFQPNAELSIEVDPRVTTFEQIDFLAESGFNRISMGVQDFTPDVQQASGRVQPYEMVARLIEHCRTRRFKGINIDLIYGLPKQTVETFTETLDKALQLRPDRVAVYSFAYLPNAMPHQMRIHQEDLPATEVKYRIFATAVEKFTGAGYRQIGMDHFALPEDELSVAQSDGRLNRNFMGYTVQQAPEMIGFGMSAIGYVNNAFFQSYSKLDSYENAIADKGMAIYRGIQLSADDLIRQYVITNLMCNFRLPFADLEAKFNVRFPDYFGPVETRMEGFIADELLTVHADRLEITPRGRTFVRNIAMTFDAYLAAEPGKAPTFSRTI
ncbi:oxygen-independent coproporphyrinogen III oxidase [candidate division GN15 bacterium]|uniref:Coproporphyrinogen-III oxidase n=1 Tax=candidate division GN15 bacterium TaxID=2072418 RepID=A0A855X832_9BACT|nr:MAG: oxygen-independent coproporphyrinogen III oxidase [candidate division GN15 bacterium]